MPEDVADQLQKLADKAGVTRNFYCRTVLEAAAKKKVDVRTSSYAEVSGQDAFALNETIVSNAQARVQRAPSSKRQ